MILTHPALEALSALWRSRCDRRLMPRRDDIAPRELAPWREHLALIEVGDGLTFRCRSLSPALNRLCGGRPVAGGTTAVHALRDDLRKACLCKAPLFLLRPIDPLRFIGDYQAVILPFSADGDRIDALLLAAYEMPKPP